jgi:MFS family permease
MTFASRLPLVSASVLRDGRFRRFFAARAVSAVGDAAIPTALALSVVGSGGSSAELGIVIAAAMVPRAALMLAGGIAADRLQKRRLMALAWLCCGLAELGTAALFLSHRSFTWIVVLQACYGLAASFSFPAAFGYLPSLVGPQSLREANALISSWTGIASLAGPALTAACAAGGVPALALAADGATFFAGVCLLAGLPPDEPGQQVPAQRSRALREGWAALRAVPWLLKVNVVEGVLLMLTVAPVMVLGPGLVARASREGWVVMMAAFAVGELSGAVGAGRLQFRHPLRTAAAGLLLLAPPPLLLAAGSGLVWLCIGEACAGVGFTVYIVLVNTSMQQAASPEHRAKIGAISAVGTYTLLPLGYILAPAAASAFGPGKVLWASAAWTALSVLILLADRTVRQARPGPEAEPAARPEAEVAT